MNTQFELVAWLNEDELPPITDPVYDKWFRYSKVDIVRLFPLYLPLHCSVCGPDGVPAGLTCPCCQGAALNTEES